MKSLGIQRRKMLAFLFPDFTSLGNGRAAVGRLGESDAQCGLGLRDIGKESCLALLRLRRHLCLTCSQQLVSKQSERRRHQERPPRASHGPRPGLGRDVRHMGAARSRRFRVRPPCRQRRRRASGLSALLGDCARGGDAALSSRPRAWSARYHELNTPHNCSLRDVALDVS